MKIALCNKVKLGFIGGSYAKPPMNNPIYDQWIRCDSMVVSWLLNSVDPSFVGAFIYANTTKELWNELTERFGQSNGPLLYKVHKEVSELYLQDDSVVCVAVYYIKMKKLWDELTDLSEMLEVDVN